MRPLSEFSASGQGGVIVCNPPYGERLLDERGAAALYRQMRGKFSALSGWSVNIITGFPEFERVYGRRADRRRKLSNGGITCQLYQYFHGREQ